MKLRCGSPRTDTFDPTRTDARDDTAADTSADGGVTFPENPDADTSSDPTPEDDPSDDPDGCPSCGSSTIADADRTLSEVPNLRDRHRTALKTHDKHCLDCGEVFDL